ncbi:hypothetical protein LOTGIDRAFT_228100 [Lottia gigantea]|uniref:Eukaryotic translation initiation factor 3 subunit J n=1 Tax=Lottia gigantea TaxID=225164 RepID=V4CSP7_LOTGI|nr:hypothetical protein LOTGIDRAFT_228100 [Lottia gigantea]ESP05570.1 hypothetical protein LOTGIDRAFT_228100 [Lottia gigantea]
MADSWDSEEFTVNDFSVKKTDKWEGEDEDDIKDSWEDDESKKEVPPEMKAYQRPKKKSLEQRLAEKEAALAAKKEEVRLEIEEKHKSSTPEGKMAEKQRIKKMQEESDLKLAKEAFGISSELEAISIETEEDFKKLTTALKDKIKTFEKHSYYPKFLENLIQDLAIDLPTEDIKRISTTISNLHHEKERQRKELEKKKKKKNKAVIKIDRADDLDLIGDATGNYTYEDDDFI